MLAEYPLEAQVVTLEGARIPDQIAEAFAADPDVLFILAGDGTARSVASKAKPDGPMIAPLPGGTMNMLPKALYGTADWKLALMGEGDIPHDEAIRLLATINYDGSLSGEWIREPAAEVVLPHDAQVLREYIAAAG